MNKLITKILVPVALDFIIKISKQLALHSKTQIDDDFVATLEENKAAILAAIALV